MSSLGRRSARGSAPDGEAVRGPGSPKDCPLQDTLHEDHLMARESVPGGEAVRGPGSPKEDGNICERSWCFRLSVVIEADEEDISSVCGAVKYFGYLSLWPFPLLLCAAGV